MLDHQLNDVNRKKVVEGTLFMKNMEVSLYYQIVIVTTITLSFHLLTFHLGSGL